MAYNLLNLAFDSIVFVLTVGKTARLALRARKLKMDSGISVLLIRDGSCIVISDLLLTEYAIRNILLLVRIDLPLRSQFLNAFIQTPGSVIYCKCDR